MLMLLLVVYMGLLVRVLDKDKGTYLDSVESGCGYCYYSAHYCVGRAGPPHCYTGSDDW